MFGAHAGNLNLDPQNFPAFAIQDPAKNAKYPYDQSKELKVEDLEIFIQDVLHGKIEPSIKSEPIPETQDGPVTVVVAHSYKELVVDNDKDVLLEFYAPWCGHCKAYVISYFVSIFAKRTQLTRFDSLAPKYDELASLYVNNPDLAAKVTVAKIDATANDVPDPITGFPTIRLYPAGAKDSPIEYEGSRTVEDLANFIFENGKHKVDAHAKPEEQQGDADVTTPPVAAPTEDEAPEVAKEEAVEHDEL